MSQSHSRLHQQQQQQTSLAFADRLIPNCAQTHNRSGDNSTLPLRSSQQQQQHHQQPLLSPTMRSRRSPTHWRARAIVKKYRNHARNVEFKRLKNLVPTVAENQKVSEVSLNFIIVFFFPFSSSLSFLLSYSMMFSSYSLSFLTFVEYF
jgi:hypothetical protein